MARNGDTFAVLQFDDRLMTATRVRRGVSGVPVVETERVGGDWSSEADLRQALSAFIQAQGPAGLPLYTVLPRQDVTARFLELPTHDSDEMANMIRLSAEEYVPFALDDLVISHCVLRRLSNGCARVLAVFAQKETVERHVRLLREAGVEPRKILLSTACLASAAAVSLKEDAQYAVANCTSDGIEILIMNGSRLEYGRATASPHDSSLTDTPLEKLAEELAQELATSLSAYQRTNEDHDGVRRVYLCSDWADVATLSRLLATQSRLDVLPGTALGGTRTNNPASATAYGAALTIQGHAPYVVDLTPRSLLERRDARTRRRTLRRALALTGLVLLAAVAYFAQAVYLRTRYIAELSTQVETLRPAAESAVEKTRQLRILQRQVDPSGSALEALAQVMKLAPASGLSITQFTYERGARIDVTGHARSTDEIDRFAKALREKGGPLFAQARRGGTKPAKEYNQDVVEYTIAIPLVAADANEDQPATNDASGADIDRPLE